MFRKHYCAKGMMSSADEINDIRRKFYSAYGVSDSVDEIGNLLRDFYSAYGIPNEGPPSSLNVGKFLGPVPQFELDILRNALNDQKAHRQFVACSSILKALSTQLENEELLREISGIPLECDQAFEQLTSGIFWFTLASSLDMRKDGVPSTPFDEEIDVPIALRVQMTVQGSLVLRLYIALVYMREGVLSDLIAQSSRLGGQCSTQVRKLLNSDYVRRIRNALSHSSFFSCIAGLVFRDDNGEIVGTPGFLSWLSTTLMLIQNQSLQACSKGIDVV